MVTILRTALISGEVHFRSAKSRRQAPNRAGAGVAVQHELGEERIEVGTSATMPPLTTDRALIGLHNELDKYR
ncbi:MAG: hypothetical protein M3443_12520 [Actinomycetota bacterium]|nr:hypothetical protein [Actinomycetota bacterium]